MLSDAEQRTLAQIETALRQDDPAFVERFGTVPSARRPTFCGMTTRGWLVAFVVAACLAWLYESAELAVAALAALGAGVSLWSLSLDGVEPGPPGDGGHRPGI